MPAVFISYRRDDASGEAGHLAADLRSHFGRWNVFMDVDSIDPGIDFDQKITNALTHCQVSLVLIGKHWASATGPDGEPRLAKEDDYVRKEIAMSLERPDVAVVPVLVEGAEVPAREQLPPDIADLEKFQAFELSNKRWRFDVQQLTRTILRHDRWWWRGWWRIPGAVKLAVPALAVAIAAALVILSGGSSSKPAKAAALFPQTSPPVQKECQASLEFAVDGTAAPLTCGRGTINTIAWQYYEHFNPSVMQLGRYATEGQVINAVCADKRGSSATGPQEDLAYQLAYLYNGWRFVLQLDPAAMQC